MMNANAAQTVTLPLNDVFDLAFLRGLPSTLTTEDRQVLLNQAQVLLNAFYVHLPLKKAMLAIDPVQRSRLLLDESSYYRSDAAFISEVLSIFLSLSDLHTNFVLPSPWNQLIAFLPFMIEEYYDAYGYPHYIISKVFEAINPSDFAPGVEITHWNGTPMARKVLELSRVTAGANQVARHARALYTLTTRPLGYELVPGEDWVTLTYLSTRGVSEIRYPWKVSNIVPTPNAPATMRADAPEAFLLGVDAQGLQVQRLQKRLFSPRQMKIEQEITISRSLGTALQAREALQDRGETTSLFPQSLGFRVVQTPSGEFGYLRIWNFDVTDVNGFVKEVERILRILPQNGLIIDVRHNPGGTIPAGEQLLQLLSPKRIEPEPVHFRNTDANRLMVHAYDSLAPWRRSMDLAVRTGSIFSQGVPLTDIEQANSIGRVYPGKVVVIIDALCYSTCCFFAAGIQDHGIGIVLGVDEITGAGGANVWTQELLLQLWQADPNSSLRALPHGASMRVAMRQATRIGLNRDVPLEGLGVRADYTYRLTRNDLLLHNVDLIAYAGQLLKLSA